MIRIKSWFPEKMRYEYLNDMLLKIGVDEKANKFTDTNEKKKFLKRFSILKRKYVEKIISQKEKDEYENTYLILKKEPNYEIMFLGSKPITLETLLTGTREKVIEEVDGIKEYMKLCRFMKNYSSGYSRAKFLKYLHDFYPDKVIYDGIGKKYQFEQNQDTITVSELQSNKKSVSDKMNPFYYFFFDIAEISPSDKTQKYSYKDFQDVVKKATNNIFNRTDLIKYDLISDDMRHKLLASLGIKCCPYCNRQYITSWEKDKQGVQSTADLDHFYQKSTYPLFALSLFNFVPSCQICNSRMKGSNETETLYPYEEGMDEFRFRCMPKDSGNDNLVDLWLASKTNEPNKLCGLYKLVLVDESDDHTDNKHIERINGSREVFCLDEVYQTHVDAAINEMLKIRIYYSGDYAKYACKTLEDLGIGKEDEKVVSNDDENAIDNKDKNRFSESEMRDIILGFVYNGQDKMDQPLGKLMSDILEYELSLKKSYNEKETE